MGQRVVSVDANLHQVRLDAGATIGYRKMVWATGGIPRRLGCPGESAGGIHTLRSSSDVDAILGDLGAARDVVIVGGGYIGLEVASSLCKYGKRITVVEALDRVLARVAAEPLSRFYEALHRAHGVQIELRTSVRRFDIEAGRVCGAQLSNGATVPAQLVVIGVGISPSTQMLLDAGAQGNNGVRVDSHCRTSLPDIYAIGDGAEHQNRFAAHAWVRLESVQNANDQAITVAKSICGNPEPYESMPTFWSSQYDVTLQIAGICRDFDDIVVRGNASTPGFSIIYLRNKKVIALDCVNAVRDYLHGRALLECNIMDRQLLADVGVSLKAFHGARTGQ
jgi:3-phenylpropionate/trans-cinnamate dioxygenase ferredoxin reductase component